MTNFLEDFLSVRLHFQRYFGMISCIVFMKEFISLTMVTMEIAKRQFISYHSNGCYEEKALSKT